MPRSASRTTATADVRERLVLAASRVLADSGYGGLKVTEVARQADANVALISYYFGGRAGLVHEVVRRSGEQVALVRGAALARLLARTPAPGLEALVRCWLDPVFDSVVRHGSAPLLKLMAHLVFAAEVDAETKRWMVAQVLEVDDQFLDAFVGCRPDLTRQALAWRMNCAVGSYCFVLGQEPPGWRALVRSASARVSWDAAYRELLAFVIGGFAAAAPPPRRPPPKSRRHPTS